MIIDDLELKRKVKLVQKFELDFEGVIMSDREALQHIKSVSEIRLKSLANDMEGYIIQYQKLISKIDTLLLKDINYYHSQSYTANNIIGLIK